jgi:hypothetical protein
MNDDQIEGLLRRVRPAGPPAELRARILGASASTGWTWLAAAAALLLLTTALQLGSAGLREPLRPAVASPSTDIERELTLALQTSLGLTENEARMTAVVDGIRFRIEQGRTNQEGRQP